MNPNEPTLFELTYALGTLQNPLTSRITDYLAGYQLGPRNGLDPLRYPTLQSLESVGQGQGTLYWTGPMLPMGHSRYGEMQLALMKSFNFRNISLEGVEFLADGVGADEADWSLVSDLEDGSETPLPPEVEALKEEAEQLLTEWWDHRDVPGTLQTLLHTAIAHGRAPLRFRIPNRYRDDAGKLTLERDPLRSLDPLHLVLPDVALSGVYVDPDTLERIGITQIFYTTANSWKNEWELTYKDPTGKTILTMLDQGGVPYASSEPLDLAGRLWLLELHYPRGAVTRDVLSNQDALNVALTMLNRNTHFAGFTQMYGIGIDPPVNAAGEPVVPAGPGSQTFFQPSVSLETTATSVNGTPVSTTKETAYPGAKYAKLDPADPTAVLEAIRIAETNIYSSLRQRFVLMDDKATASGRSREVATGSFLRATARYGSKMEHLIRELLELALAVSGIIQGQPGKYAGFRANVTCSQKVFDPSPLQVASDLSLQQAGVISRQTLQTRVGISDPAAEDARILEEAQPPEPVPKQAPTDDMEPPTTV